MNWSEFYFVCFLVGFSFSALAVIAGSVHLHIPHVHFHHGIHVPRGGGQGAQLPYFNFGTVSAFLAWFGGIGYLLQRYSGMWYVAVLAIATLSGLAAASSVFWFLAKVLIAREKPLDQADYDMVGVLGRVSLPIRPGGTGEIIYSQEGTRHVTGARGEEALAIPKDAEVIVTRYEKGIAYVRPWQDPAEDWGAQQSLRRFMPNEVFVIAGLIVLVFLLILMAFAGMFRKAGPHEAIIVYGLGGTRVVKGRGTFIFPLVETSKDLSLQLMSFDVAPQQDLYTKQGVAVTVEAVAQIKVKSDPESILTAAEQFLTKTPQEREGLIRLVMEGHLRGIIGQLTVEEIVKQPEMVGDRMRSTCAEDINKMGLEVISFTIKEVRDKNEYISNMGRPDVARIKRDADVAAAEADRDTAMRRAIASRNWSAKPRRGSGAARPQDAFQAKQAEAQRDLEVKKAAYAEMVKKQQAQADKAYDIQTNIMLQQVRAEEVTVMQVQKEHEVKVQDAEILRRDRELTATVFKQAEYERKRIETMAEAEKQRLITEAEGHAASIRVQGEAEAEIIFKKGEAEAKAMNVKATAYQEFNQAAIVDKLITNMPEVVRALAAPLANVDKITVISTGNGDTAGLNKITGDITKMAAQIPALFETLSGMPLSDLFAKVRLIGDNPPKPDDKSKGAAAQ